LVATISMGSSVGRVASPNGSRPCQDTVHRPGENRSSGVGSATIRTPLSLTSRFRLQGLLKPRQHGCTQAILAAGLFCSRCWSSQNAPAAGVPCNVLRDDTELRSVESRVNHRVDPNNHSLSQTRQRVSKSASSGNKPNIAVNGLAATGRSARVDTVAVEG
jgi:hypothetical protein